MKKLIIIILLLYSCGSNKSPNDLGYVEKLPKGKYIIENRGSRHLIRCTRPDGKYFWLNDADFSKNGIPGYDAHKYVDPTSIIIK